VITAAPARIANPYDNLTIGIVAAYGSSSNPIKANERDIVSLNKLAYESLIELDDYLKPVPLLADRWIRDEDAYTFYIRDVPFHNGTRLTAHDVKASYEAILNEGESNPYYANVHGYIAEMSVQDDLTLTVRAKRQCYMFLYAMTFPIIQRDSIYTAQPWGTGPFWYIDNIPDAGLRLERNPHWWKVAPSVQALNTIRYDTPEAAMRGFETGALDMVATRSGITSLSGQLSDRHAMDYATQVYEMIIPNTTKELLADVEVRRALMYAIDRDAIADTAYQGMVKKSEVPVQPGCWLYETQSATYNYSPEYALKILNDAGWSDEEKTGTLHRVKDNRIQELAFSLITYQEPTSSRRLDAAKLIAGQLGKIGIRVEVSTMRKSNMREALRSGEFDLALVAENLSAIPDLSFMLAEDGAYNFSKYINPLMHNELTAARNALTQEALAAAMSKIQLLIIEDLPIMGLFYRSGKLVSRTRLAGLTGIREDQILRGFEYIGSL
jgi:peptide/nickel transport system substrate-binding protein